MRQRSILVSMAVLVIGLALAYSVFAQQTAQGQRQGQPAAQGQRQGQAGRGGRAPLFFREEWKQTPAGGEHPVTPAEAVANPNLELKLYGTTSKEIQLVAGRSGSNVVPTNLWTGTTTTPSVQLFANATTSSI